MLTLYVLFRCLISPRMLLIFINILVINFRLFFHNLELGSHWKRPVFAFVFLDCGKKKKSQKNKTTYLESLNLICLGTLLIIMGMLHP